MCQHCETEDIMEVREEGLRHVEGCSNPETPNFRIPAGSSISRIVDGCEEDSLPYITAIDNFNFSPPLASSTFLNTRSKHSRLRTPPLASSTFISTSSRHSRLRTPPVASSTMIHSSTMIRSSETSEDSGCGKSISLSREHKVHSSASREHRRRSTGMFRTSTRNDLTSTDRDQRPGNASLETKSKKKLFPKDIKSAECPRKEPKESVITRKMKKRLVKKFLSFSESANRSDLCTIACL